ncbi:MAG: serine/threonine protein kinase, partial [Myxococcales bacterium]|nr:serine/threonine protein kinase [Myxococcales bacterium]
MDQLGSYRLRKRLAVGGMGEVYLGEKIGPEGFVKPVVLKCVLPQLAKDRAFVQLFLDEARLAALLNHPNIAQVYDFGLVDDVYYIAMEYVPGYTVDDIRRKLKSIGQFMPLQHIANIASQVCQGLHYAHSLTDANGVSLGLVHRDVSPHNLIVSIDGSVKIVDFGIAKARAGLTRVQAKGAVGKFGYMSPEQARGEQVDARSDTFSLGICLWELCTNERLHDPSLDRAPDYSPARPIPPVDSFRHEVPRQFQQIIDVALAIDVEDRYGTTQDMHLALERFQAAMTHYAGQAALAQYIKDLVEGRVENPEGHTGSVVEPAGRGAGPRSSGPAVENMDGAQKYEEVFGVTMSSKRPRPSMRAVPKSWETTEAPPRPSPPPKTERPGPRMVDLSGGRSTPELETPELASHTPRRAP